MSKKKKPRTESVALQSELQDRLWTYLTDFALLENRCMASIKSYERLVQKTEGGQVFETKDGPLMFLDRGGSILAVAHLDAVGKIPHFFHGLVENERWVFSPWLDDRLGVFILLDVLPRLGFNYDILLCTNEEQGHSTSFHFQPPEGKTWNFMFECDRMGTDLVNYQYHQKDLERDLKSVGFPAPLRGSYTDIVDLEHLEIGAFNVGIAYEQAHSKWCRANLHLTYGQLLKLSAFLLTYGETRYPFDPKQGYRPPKPAASNGTLPGASGGYNYSYTYPEPKHFPFERGDRVWLVKEQVMGQITGTIPSYYSHMQKCHAWQVKRETAAVVEWSSVLEADLEVVWRNGKHYALAEWLKADRNVRVVVGATVEEVLKGNLKNRSELFWEQYLLAQGPEEDQAVRNARVVYESLYAGEQTVHSHSTQPPDKVVCEFLPGDRVHTPYGKGQVDAYFPLVLESDEPHYWVRHDTPDADTKTTVDLVPRSEITRIDLPTEEGAHVPETPAG